VITLGNHAYRHREIYPYLDEEAADPAPGQLPAQPARPRPHDRLERDGVRLAVINLSGNVFMTAGRSAFAEADALLAELRGKADHILVDMHAEATSEKVALGWHLDGRVTAVLGTHTHVPTADARVLRAAPPTSPTSA
jgi:calcineurin-like phosphoesterase